MVHLVVPPPALLKQPTPAELQFCLVGVELCPKLPSGLLCRRGHIACHLQIGQRVCDGVPTHAGLIYMVQQAVLDQRVANKAQSLELLYNPQLLECTMQERGVLLQGDGEVVCP